MWHCGIRALNFTQINKAEEQQGCKTTRLNNNKAEKQKNAKKNNNAEEQG